MKVLQSNTYQKQQGLTLSELLVSLFIFSLLISSLGAVANSLLSKNRMINTGNLLINDINLVRSTALNLGKEITFCSANTAGDDCSGGNSWGNGWIVFVDSNGNRSLDSNEEILRQQGPIGGSVTVTSSWAVPDWNSYQSDGSVTYLGRFNICDPNQGTAPRKVVLARVRRPYISGEAVITCP